MENNYLRHKKTQIHFLAKFTLVHQTLPTYECTTVQKYTYTHPRLYTYSAEQEYLSTI